MFAVTRHSIENLPAYSNSLATVVKPNDAFYLIFTSGMTGKPKDCIIEHASFINGAVKLAESWNINAASRVLQMARYTFDISTLEDFTSLAVGACTCMPSEQDIQKGIAGFIHDYGVTFAITTPSLIRLENPKDVPNLKTLVLGGEAPSVLNVHTWAGKVQLINGYGPSECSVISTFGALSKNTDPASIGRGSNSLCWILDPKDHHRLMPIGALGELLIHGPSVARGYLEDSKEMAEVFIKQPAFVRKGCPQRFYKTGDLVRFNSDGTINFVGRKDTQVKVRVQRLELGEIEYHISSEDRVQHALVLLPKSGRCQQ